MDELRKVMVDGNPTLRISFKKYKYETDKDDAAVIQHGIENIRSGTKQHKYRFSK